MAILNLASADKLQYIKPSEFNALKEPGQHTLQLGSNQYTVIHDHDAFHVSSNAAQPTAHQQDRAAQMAQTLNQFPALLSAHINAANDKTETRLRQFENFNSVDQWIHDGAEHQQSLQILRGAGLLHDTRDSIMELRQEPPSDATRQAIPEWVQSEALRNVNVRSLGNWSLDQSAWVNRNRTDDVQQGRTPKPDPNQSHNIPHGAVLNAPDEAWTDYLNQGWMQNGIDRGAAFKLATTVPDNIVEMHNQAVQSGDHESYAKQIEGMANQPGPSKFLKPDDSDPSKTSSQLTFYAQELVDLARAGYSIHKDPSGNQVAVPKGKADMLTSVRPQDVADNQ